MNQVVLVGRIADMETKKNGLKLIISVNNSYKNSNGVYESNLIPCIVKGSIIGPTQECCMKGSIIGLKGSLKSDKQHLYVSTDKITVLSTNTNDNKKDIV